MENGMTPTSGARIKRILAGLARTAIACLTLYLVVESVSWRSVEEAFRTARMAPLLGGVALLLLNLAFRIRKWQTMVDCLRSGTTFREAARSLLLGISFGSVTPVEIGELAGRALHLPGARRSHIVGLTLLDRLQILLFWILFGVSALALLMVRPGPWQWLAVAAALVLPSIFAWRLDLLGRLGHAVNDRWMQRGWITRILDGFSCLTAAARARSLALTVGFHLVLCAQLYAFVNAFAIVGLPETVLAASAVMFVKAVLPISLADLGVREMAAVYFFGLFGVPAVAALNASLLLFVVNIVIPGAAGALEWWLVRTRQRGVSSSEGQR